MNPIYLDYNATTPVHPHVLEAMLPWFTTQFGNAASSTHAFGWQAAEAVKIAREQVASLIGATPEEIIFTSGSTEALNLAIKGAAEAYAAHGNHFITFATEHKAVLDTLEWLRKKGAEVTVLPVNPDGLPDLQQFEAAFTPRTVMACVMLANNETGVIHPLAQISEITHRHKALLLSDATQAIGKIPVDVNELGIDLLPVSAHKFYGPKGCGALFVRRRNPRAALLPLLHGGGHERGLRSGTLNVPGIVGLGAAAQLAQQLLLPAREKIAGMRDQLENELIKNAGAKRNGHPTLRLPTTSNLSFPGVNMQTFLRKIPSLAVATGSACTSANPEPSHVLRAMGLPDNEAHGSLRISLGHPTTQSEIDNALGQLLSALGRG